MLCALALTLAACENGRQPRADAPISSHRCRNAPAVAVDSEAARPGRLAGDVDGDGSTDQVRLAVDPRARPGCRAFVVVRTAGGRLVAPIEERDLQTALGFPALDSLVGVDDRAGDEIVVRVTAGASTEFAGLFTIVDGELRRVRLDGPHGSLFPSGGSAAHLEASNCGPDGQVVIATATARDGNYVVERRFYLFDGVRLVKNDSRTERHRVSPDELASLPEFRTPPFSLCAAT